MTEVQEHANYVIETVRVREAVGVVHQLPYDIRLRSIQHRSNGKPRCDHP
jgi:hypothetical protein